MRRVIGNLRENSGKGERTLEFSSSSSNFREFQEELKGFKD